MDNWKLVDQHLSYTKICELRDNPKYRIVSKRGENVHFFGSVLSLEEFRNGKPWKLFRNKSKKK